MVLIGVVLTCCLVLKHGVCPVWVGSCDLQLLLRFDLSEIPVFVQNSVLKEAFFSLLKQ